MSRYTYLLLLPILTVAAPAAAQEAASTFSGPRVEATVGWDQLRFDLGNLGATGRGRSSDLGYGAAVGYDVALTPNLVGGVEAAATLSNVRFATGDVLNGGYLRERREIDVAGRLGTAITPNTLLYGKVGYANLQVRQATTLAGVNSGRLRDLNGVLLGAGAEVKVSPTAYLKSEYRYTNYQDGYTGNAVMTGLGIRF